MTTHHQQNTMTTPREYRLDVQVAGKPYHLNFRQAFRFGYVMARTRKFKEAAQVFEALTHTQDPGRIAATMLAYCKAGMKDYKACNALLCTAFPAEAAEEVEDLQAAFVYLSLGMWDDAADELTSLARKWPNLPLVCLLLGDVFASQRKRTKAIISWRLAVSRDREGGAVAATARDLVSSQTKQHNVHKGAEHGMDQGSLGDHGA